MDSNLDISKLSKLKKEDLVKIIDALSKSNNINEVKEQSITDDKIVIISNIMGKIALCPTKSREINFENYGTKRMVLFNDVNLIIENPRYQVLFQKGFLYFEDEKYYDKFYISKPEMLMTFENIKKVLNTKSESELIDFLDKFSENKTCVNFMHFFPAMTARLVRDGYNLDYRSREIINDYFSIKFDSLVGIIDLYNKKLI